VWSDHIPQIDGCTRNKLQICRIHCNKSGICGACSWNESGNLEHGVSRVESMAECFISSHDVLCLLESSFVGNEKLNIALRIVWDYARDVGSRNLSHWPTAAPTISDYYMKNWLFSSPAHLLKHVKHLTNHGARVPLIRSRSYKLWNTSEVEFWNPRQKSDVAKYRWNIRACETSSRQTLQFWRLSLNPNTESFFRSNGWKIYACMKHIHCVSKMMHTRQYK